MAGENMKNGYSTLNKENGNGKGGNNGTIHPSRPVLSEGLSPSKGAKALRFIRERAEFRKEKDGISDAEWKKKADARYAKAVESFCKARDEIKPGERRMFYELVEMLSESTKIGWEDYLKSISMLPKHLGSGFLHTVGMVEEAAMSGKAIPELEHTRFTNPHELFRPKK